MSAIKIYSQLPETELSIGLKANPRKFSYRFRQIQEKLPTRTYLWQCFDNKMMPVGGWVDVRVSKGKGCRYVMAWISYGDGIKEERVATLRGGYGDPLAVGLEALGFRAIGKNPDLTGISENSLIDAVAECLMLANPNCVCAFSYTHP